MDPTTDNIYTWYNSGGWGQFYLYRTQKKKKKKKKDHYKTIKKDSDGCNQ